MTFKKAKELIVESERTGRPMQQRLLDGWIPLAPDERLDRPDSVYRVEPPEPPKPREIWCKHSDIGNDFASEEHRKHLLASGYVLFREVLEEVKS